ncbi:MAG: MBOAT family O-acyltransferase [Myxococcota bacterium]
MLFTSLEYVAFLLVVFVVFWSTYRPSVFLPLSGSLGVLGVAFLIRHAVVEGLVESWQIVLAGHLFIGAALVAVALRRGGRFDRALVLLVASYIFYMSWNATFIVLIVGSTVLDFFVGLFLDRTDEPTKRRFLLGLSLLGNLGVLGLFKYFNFFADAVHDGFAQMGVEVGRPQTNLILPVGISFYTFQTLSYTIDIYRRQLKPTTNFLEFATFVSFFPQLVAGPIVRASDFLPQFEHPRRVSADTASNGVFLIVRGMAKKILIADFLALNWIDRVWEDPGAYSSGEVWLAVFGYTWQLYADFSGYTDIARGSAKFFGFELPENFRRPFNSTGPIDFWSKWHITLSTWVRDYVYIPLGGSKKGAARSYFNLFLAFLAAGVWHGAGWTFVIFGLWHGSTVALNRMLRDAARGRLEPLEKIRPLVVAFNLSLFVVHWPTFRSPSLDNMLEMYARMFAFDFTAMRASAWVWFVIVGFTLVHFSPQRWMDQLRRQWVALPAGAQAILLVAAAGFLVWVGSAQAAPFIYFQF